MRYKSVRTRTVQEIVYSKISCDVCGGDADPPDYYDHSVANIEAKLGDVYPESDNREVYEVDVCPKCFMDKVVPAIEALGCKFRKRYIDEQDWVMAEPKL